MRHSNKKLDLTGQRFGKLTALAPAENIGGCTAWLCRCDCGQETVVITKRLRDGHRTSCGCDNENFGKPPNVAGRASVRRYLGCFESFDDAVEARKRAEAELHLPFLEKYQGKDAVG